MRILLLLLLGVLATWSCCKDEKLDTEESPQKWVLVKMTGQIPNSDTTGENMEWQEYYLLNSDGTFLKERDWDGIKTSAMGDYSFTDRTDGKYLELKHHTNSQIIGSCYADNNEILRFLDDNKLTGTWSHCDGPGLDYKRVD